VKYVVQSLVIVVFALLGVMFARARSAEVVRPYDRERGELSPGTQAPTRAQMLSAIRSAPASQLQAVLEYGERVECLECVGLLHKKILESNDAVVREMAAWWVRKRPYGANEVFVGLRNTLNNDADARRRSRAAEALGEFMEPTGYPSLKNHALSDADASVRAACVRALGRLNYAAADLDATLAKAMQDADALVRDAALRTASQLNVLGATTQSHLGALLGDADAAVRRRAARQAGHHRVTGAVPALAKALLEDSDRDVRQAAAWALGKIGSEQARTALAQAQTREGDTLVRDAIEVAQYMR